MKELATWTPAKNQAERPCFVINQARALLIMLFQNHKMLLSLLRLHRCGSGDSATVVRVTDRPGREVVLGKTPLALATFYLSSTKIGGKDAPESQLHSLEASWRLLMRVEAAHAVSWLWASDAPSATHTLPQRVQSRPRKLQRHWH